MDSGRQASWMTLHPHYFDSFKQKKSVEIDVTCIYDACEYCFIENKKINCKLVLAQFLDACYPHQFWIYT